MLHDFLLLEMYFGSGSSSQFIEDVIGKYGWPALRKALREGLMTMRPVLLGPDSGRCICGLSPKGRDLARRKA